MFFSLKVRRRKAHLVEQAAAQGLIPRRSRRHAIVCEGLFEQLKDFLPFVVVQLDHVRRDIDPGTGDHRHRPRWPRLHGHGPAP